MIGNSRIDIFLGAGGPGWCVGHSAVGADAKIELVGRIEDDPHLRKERPGELVGLSRAQCVVVNGFPDCPQLVDASRTVDVDLLVEFVDLLVERLENQRHFSRRNQKLRGEIDRLVGMTGIVPLPVDVVCFIQNGAAYRQHGCGCNQCGSL